MEEIVFSLEYTDRNSGKRVRQEVAELGLAQRLAKELARASGRRVIVRRVSTTRRPTWSVILVNASSGSIRHVWTGLSKREVLMRWKRWNEHKMGASLIAWPDSFPPLAVEMQAA